jgi:hypothetical protein
MSQQIIQTNFHFNTSVADFKQFATEAALPFERLQGLQWKIFLLNEERKEAGGIYLFVNKNAVANFKSSELFHGIVTNPAFHSVNFKQFNIIESASLLTHAPLGQRQTIL